MNKTLVPPDTCFTYEIIARGKEMTTLVNGQVAASYTENRPGRPERGRIALQHENPDTAVFFRRIVIKELAPGDGEAKKK